MAELLRNLTNFALVGTFDRFSVGDESVITRSFSNLKYMGIAILSDEATRKLTLRYPADEENLRQRRVRRAAMLPHIDLFEIEGLTKTFSQTAQTTLWVISAYEERALRASVAKLLREEGVIYRISAGTDTARKAYEDLNKEVEAEQYKKTRGKLSV